MTKIFLKETNHLREKLYLMKNKTLKNLVLHLLMLLLNNKYLLLKKHSLLQSWKFQKTRKTLKLARIEK